MKLVRYAVGVIGFLLVWFVVAIVIGLVVTFLFPMPRTETGDIQMHRIGISLDWRNLPGTILGLLAGIQSFRASIKTSKEKANA